MNSKYVDLTKKETILSKSGDKISKILMIMCSLAVLYGVVEMTADNSVERELRLEQSQR